MHIIRDDTKWYSEAVAGVAGATSEASGTFALLDVDRQMLNVSETPEVHLQGCHSPRNEDLARVEMAVLGLIFAIDIVGNSIVTFVLRSHAKTKKLSRMNAMIAHLTGADFFVGIFHVLPQLAWKITFHFHGGQFLCKFVAYFQLVGMFASSYVLVTTAIDRYVAICHPLKMHSWTVHRMHLLAVFAWCLAFVFALPQLFIFSFVSLAPTTTSTSMTATARQNETTNDTMSHVMCHAGRGGGANSGGGHVMCSDCVSNYMSVFMLGIYVTWVTLSIFIVPLLILILVYANICLAVWRSVSFKDKRGARAGDSSAAAILSSVPLTSTVGSPALSAGGALACRLHIKQLLENGGNIVQLQSTAGGVLSLADRHDTEGDERGGMIPASQGRITTTSTCTISTPRGNDRISGVDTDSVEDQDTTVQCSDICQIKLAPLWPMCRDPERHEHSRSAPPETPRGIFETSSGIHDDPLRVSSSQTRDCGDSAHQPASSQTHDCGDSAHQRASSQAHDCGDSAHQRTSSQTRAYGDFAHQRASSQTRDCGDSAHQRTSSQTRDCGDSAHQCTSPQTRNFGDSAHQHASGMDCSLQSASNKSRHEANLANCAASELSVRLCLPSSECKQTVQRQTLCDPSSERKQNASIRKKLSLSNPICTLVGTDIDMLESPKSPLLSGVQRSSDFQSSANRPTSNRVTTPRVTTDSIFNFNPSFLSNSPPTQSYSPLCFDESSNSYYGFILTDVHDNARKSINHIRIKEHPINDVTVSRTVSEEADNCQILSDFCNSGTDCNSGGIPMVPINVTGYSFRDTNLHPGRDNIRRGSTVEYGRKPFVRVMSSAKIRTVKLTLVVIASYIICYSPFFVSQMWAAWDENAPFEDHAMVIIVLLASLNSCTNPWIYLSFNGHLTRQFKRCRRKLKGGLNGRDLDDRSRGGRRGHGQAYHRAGTSSRHTSQSTTSGGRTGTSDYSKFEFLTIESQ